MKRVIALAAILVSLSGCSGAREWYVQHIVGPEYNLCCRHHAVTCAQVLGEEHREYRIYLGELQSGWRHIQVWGEFPDGWHWCTATDGYVSAVYDEDQVPKWRDGAFAEITTDEMLVRLFR